MDFCVHEFNGMPFGQSKAPAIFTLFYSENSEDNPAGT